MPKLKNNFLDEKARSVNQNIWNKLSFDIVKNNRIAKQLSVANIDVLNDMLNQITDLTDISWN